MNDCLFAYSLYISCELWTWGWSQIKIQHRIHHSSETMHSSPLNLTNTLNCTDNNRDVTRDTLTKHSYIFIQGTSNEQFKIQPNDVHLVHLLRFLPVSLPSTDAGYHMSVLGWLRSCVKFKYSKNRVHPVIQAAPIAIMGLLCMEWEENHLCREWTTLNVLCKTSPNPSVSNLLF